MTCIDKNTKLFLDKATVISEIYLMKHSAIITSTMNQPTPVFLHGYSGDGESLREFAEMCFPAAQPVCIDLPGFGKTSLIDPAAETDPYVYLDETWQAVRRAVPEGAIHLVGHSYGALLAFALAAKYPDAIVQVDLFTPGVRPNILPRAGLMVAKAVDRIPGGLRVFAWVFQRKLLVDMVTRSMENKDWPEARKRQIRAMRRKESLSYTPRMFRLSFHALRMPHVLDDVRCTVPVRVVYATDDTITSHLSCEWLQQRSDTIEVIATHGGHLGIVADPKRMANVLYATT
jgi:pimeloyl-ACP methyl ester carboxylesterase